MFVMCILPKLQKLNFLQGSTWCRPWWYLKSHLLPLSNLVLSASATQASLLFTELAKFISSTGSLHRLCPMPRTVFLAKSFWDISQKSPPKRSYPIPRVKLLSHNFLLIYALHRLIAFESTLLQYLLSSFLSDFSTRWGQRKCHGGTYYLPQRCCTIMSV